ncbi:cold-inducible protein YdjO-related protein [Ammoniphilus resinae]|uniref:Cold-shock protein n=1 Tax=Ammoniphilus resinae TaxID=861532 RepID=A0ABS4GUK5_9BACL|nr:cold-inducible protein YdjO-related protein [Ammoniphilus resinae]MBP1933727.1 hypothetical protein [Ammoniphilus resinae]
MFFNRKKDPEPIEEMNTDIWRCVGDSCSGWSRKEFSFSTEPTCPFCDGEMVSDTRMLPILMDRLPN